MRTAAAVILALAVASARAGDAPAADADSIAAAKRDFDSIKASTASPVAGTSLPTIDMKEIGPTPGAPALEAPTPLPTDKDLSLDPTKKKSGTGNWLVDAMEKNKDGTTKSGKAGDDLLKDDADLAADTDKEDGRGGKEAQANAEARDGSGPKDTSHVYNPLD